MHSTGRLADYIVLVGYPLVVGVVIGISLQVKQLIVENQRSTLQARQANVERQQDLQNYVKCLTLLRFDNPELGPQSTRSQVESALDKCAKVR